MLLRYLFIVSLKGKLTSAKVKGLIEKIGCKIIYLPSNSSDLNPIEYVWTNLKRLLKKLPKKEQNLKFLSTNYTLEVCIL